jgi:hypothetical protein
MEASMTKLDIMSPSHPRWNEFQRRLAMPVVRRCDHEADEPLDLNCDGHSYKHARRVMAEMDGIDIDGTLKYFAEETTHCCDCATLTDDAICQTATV